jgi:beta-galactosidase
MLDAFWETKGYAGPTEFRQWNNSTVPLSRFKERVYTTADIFTSDIEVAHFGAKPFANATSHWSIVTSSGKVVASGNFDARAIPRGKSIALGKVTADLSRLAAPAQYKLVVELHAGASTFKNNWNFWLYPAKVDTAVPASILMISSWPEAEARLASGGKVLFLPKGADLDSTDPRFTSLPIFWNHLMNPNGTTMLGSWNDVKHPALAGFPTESNCDWQWIDITANTRALNVDTLPKALQPIVQPIDDWNCNLKLALVYECRVGAGQLMVCGIDLDAKRPGTPSLRRSILDYMASAKFKPATPITVADLRAHWFSLDPHHVDPSANVPKAPTSPDLVDPGQIRRPPQ